MLCGLGSLYPVLGWLCIYAVSMAPTSLQVEAGAALYPHQKLTSHSPLLACTVIFGGLSENTAGPMTVL
jgi:hypothetical protein